MFSKTPKILTDFIFTALIDQTGMRHLPEVSCPFLPDIATFYGMAWNKRISFEKCENHLYSTSFDNGQRSFQASWQYFLNTTSKASSPVNVCVVDDQFKEHSL